MVCLRAAGQTRKVDEPFDVLTGSFMEPPFHYGCRTTVAPWVPGMISDQKKLANAEIMRRPRSERRFGPGGYEGRLPGVPRLGRVSTGRPSVLSRAPDLSGLVKGDGSWLQQIGADDLARWSKLEKRLEGADDLADAYKIMREMAEFRAKHDLMYQFSLRDRVKELNDRLFDLLEAEAGDGPLPKHLQGLVASALRDIPKPYLDFAKANTRDALMGAQEVRRAYGRLSPLHGKFAEMVELWTSAPGFIPEVRERLASGGWSLIRHMLRSAKPAPVTLYRGMWATPGSELAEWIKTATVGSRIDLGPVSSLSSEFVHARRFTGGQYAVIMEIDDMPAIPVSGMGGNPAEMEWLGGGRLEVTEVKVRNELQGMEGLGIIVKAKWVGW